MRPEDLHEENWKDEAPLLASLDRHVELDVPEGYFEGFSAKILDRLHLEETAENAWKDVAPALAALEKEQDLDVPEGYFEGLSSRVMDQVNAGETENAWKEMAPVLAWLEKEDNLDVPDGYFEELPIQVLDRIQQLDHADTQIAGPLKPKRLKSPRILAFRRNLFWGVAAGIVLLVAAGSYFLTRADGAARGMSLTDKAINEEAARQLASLESSTVAADLDVTHVSDEQLYAALGKDAHKAFDATEHAVKTDEAYEYLKDIDLDAIDLQGLNIDMEDLEL